MFKSLGWITLISSIHPLSSLDKKVCHDHSGARTTSGKTHFNIFSTVFGENAAYIPPERTTRRLAGQPAKDEKYGTPSFYQNLMRPIHSNPPSARAGGFGTTTGPWQSCNFEVCSPQKRAMMFWRKLFHSPSSIIADIVSVSMTSGFDKINS